MTPEAIALIRKDTDQFLAETMRDPDMVTRSQEFRDGYAQGFREALAATLALVANRRLTVGPRA